MTGAMVWSGKKRSFPFVPQRLGSRTQHDRRIFSVLCSVAAAHAHFDGYSGHQLGISGIDFDGIA